jgi:hypothetical protein
MDGDPKQEKVIVNIRPMCICGHSTMYHPIIGGSSHRHACGKVNCDCRCWRSLNKNMNIHKGKKR